MIIAPNERELSAKQGSTPTVAIITPASAGPTTRAEWNDHAVEADRVDDPVWADHLDREALAGRVVDGVDGAAREDEHEDHPGGRPCRRGDGEEREGGERHQRLGDDQQATLGEAIGEQPPQAPKRRIGRNWSAVVMPTATPLPVSARISQISATVCIQLPDSETSWPAK